MRARNSAHHDHTTVRPIVDPPEPGPGGPDCVEPDREGPGIIPDPPGLVPEAPEKG